MHLARRAWCRTYQMVFRIALPILPYTEPRILEHAEDVPAVLQKSSIQKVLIVTDPGIARLGLTASLKRALTAQGIGVTVYSETRANPTVSNVEEAAALYRENDCRAIIGFGGGSAMAAPRVWGRALRSQTSPSTRCAACCASTVSCRCLLRFPLPLVREAKVTLAAVITDDETHYKYSIDDFVLIPRFAVHDPEFTRGLPASITGQTGMDALTHAVEAFIGRSTTPYTRKMARQAVQLIRDNLLEAYEHGDDMRARRNMLSAAYKAGVALTRSYVGYVHAIAHSLGGRYGIPHGLANAIILPHMLRAYGDAAAPKLADLARMAGIAPATAQDSLAAEAFIDWVDRMNDALGIPKYVLGIRRSDIPQMAAHADTEANPLYPVPLLMDRLELEHVYEIVAGGMFEGEN